METAEDLQVELDRCRGLVRLLGVNNFGSLEEGIRKLADTNEPLLLGHEIDSHDVRLAIGRIQGTVSRLHDDADFRALLPFRFELMRIALAMLCARHQINPMWILGELEEQFLRGMHHLKENATDE